ncbi:MAG: cyclic nucleotide-binding domain-containing protein [Pseudomonadales bacterium]
MKIKDLSSYKAEEILTLMRRIPFFKELQEQQGDQLERLLGYSCIVELEPGETIMRRGDRGSWLYFLIKGRLSVYFDLSENANPLNHITPGELFGDVALLCDHERKATVAADKGDKAVLLFATDFKPFGDLHDFTAIDVHTKLIFYRTMVHSIRWRLEVNRMENPDHPLISELRRAPTHNGERGGMEELESLYLQAQFLASLLDRWNSEGASLQDVMVVSPDTSPARL